MKIKWERTAKPGGLVFRAEKFDFYFSVQRDEATLEIRPVHSPRHRQRISIPRGYTIDDEPLTDLHLQVCAERIIREMLQ